MIPKSCFVLVLCVAGVVSGASFSNVFVQTGPEVAPAVELVQYDTPSYAFEYGSPQTAQLNAAPFGFEYPFAQSYGYRAPCTSGACLYPGQTVAAAGSIPPSANLAYSAPNYNALNPGYEYSYLIVNPNAGEQKNDVGLVRGEYSYLQPGGFVRELQYVPEDTQGVNAIVKHFLPVEEVKYTEIVHHTPPCPEVKSEALTEALNEDHDARHGGHEEPKAVEHSEVHEKQESIEENPEGTEEHGIIEHHEDDVEAHEKSPESDVEQIEQLPEHHLKSHHEGLEEVIVVPENHGSHSHTHENIVERTHARVPHEHHNAASHEHGVVENNVYVSYDDIMKCIQAAMAKVNIQTSVPRPISPLTYLVYNKPC